MLDKSLTPSQNPPIHHIRTLGRIMLIHELLLPLTANCYLTLAFKPEKLHLPQIEIQRVDPLQNNIRQNLPHSFFPESEIVASDNGRIDEEETDAVGSVFRDNVHWVRVIFELFRHLFAVTTYCELAPDSRVWPAQEEYSRGEDETSDDEVLPWRSLEKMSTQYEQGVEPSSSLIDTLRDKVCRVRLLESLNVLKGVV